MKIELDISDEHLASVICSGIESGIAYWCVEVEYCSVDSLKDVVNRDRYHLPLLDGGFIKFTSDEEVGDRRKFKLDRKAIQKGLQIIADKFPHHLGACLGDQQNQDAETGDVFIQCAIFGDIIFG